MKPPEIRVEPEEIAAVLREMFPLQYEVAVRELATRKLFQFIEGLPEPESSNGPHREGATASGDTVIPGTR
jgi:hypothetical protein